MSEELNNGRLLDRDYHFHSKLLVVKIAVLQTIQKFCNYWWLRSPSTNHTYSAYHVYPDGGLGGYYVDDGSYGRLT